MCCVVRIGYSTKMRSCRLLLLVTKDKSFGAITISPISNCEPTECWTAWTRRQTPPPLLKTTNDVSRLVLIQQLPCVNGNPLPNRATLFLRQHLIRYYSVRSIYAPCFLRNSSVLIQESFVASSL